MSMTEQGAQALQTVSTQLLQQGVRLSVRVASYSTSTVVKAVKAARTAKKTTGHVKMKDLTKIGGGDVHVQEIDPGLRKTLSKELNAHGVTFSTEKAADGKLYVHFSGRDLPMLEHALNQAEARLETQASKERPSKGAEQPTKDASRRDEAPTKKDTAPEATRADRKPANKSEVMSRIKTRAEEITTTAAKAPKPVRTVKTGSR